MQTTTPAKASSRPNQARGRTRSLSRMPASSATSSGLLAIRIAALEAVVCVRPIVRNAMTPAVCNRPMMVSRSQGMAATGTAVPAAIRARWRSHNQGNSVRDATKKRSAASHSGGNSVRTTLLATKDEPCRKVELSISRR
ncbi:hypothetical protein D3C79_676170 [compost metagenome]